MLVESAGLVVVGAGTVVLPPTLIGLVSRNVVEPHRGRATSLATTVSYLGFLAGPVYAGLWADAAGLRGAMIAVAALAVSLLALAPTVLRISGYAADDGTIPEDYEDARLDFLSAATVTYACEETTGG